MIRIFHSTQYSGKHSEILKAMAEQIKTMQK